MSKFFNSYLSIKVVVCIALLFLLTITSQQAFSDEVITGSNLRIGGKGGSSQTLQCSTGKRITGINVYTREFIHKIAIRCTTITSSGKWLSRNNHSWSSFTRSDAIPNATDASSALCSQDQFVVGLSGSRKRVEPTDVWVLDKLTIACRKSGPNGTGLVGGGLDRYTVSSSAILFNNTFTLPDTVCSGGGFAYKLKAKRGWYLDSAQLTCKMGLPGWTREQSAVNIDKVTSVSPKYSDVVTKSRIPFLFNKVSNATKYEFCIRGPFDSNCFYTRKHAVANSSAIVTVNIPVPKGKRGLELNWKVRGCNNVKCGAWSSNKRFIWLAEPPELTSPGANSLLIKSRTTHFSWASSKFASGGYRLLIWPYNYPTPASSKEAGDKHLINLKSPIGMNRTKYSVSIPKSFGEKVIWAVATCQGRYDSKCGELSTPRVLNFSKVILNTNPSISLKKTIIAKPKIIQK